ncbi:MAG: peptidoglycan-associated lipoprotein Pal [Smithellaceae bacterium]|nr:peptidoglycan-associated lipoprotein Pal [Smithellaceae bacterium]
MRMRLHGSILVVALFLVSVVFLSGCPKKTLVHEEALKATERPAAAEQKTAVQEQKVEAPKQQAAVSPPPESPAQQDRDRLAREQAEREKFLREQAERERLLREQQLKEQALKEQALKEKLEKERTLREQPQTAKIAPEEKGVVARAPALREKVELANVLFDFDKHSIRSDAKEILRHHAEWLLKQKNAKLVIEGHCDERGTNEYNLALGERRAQEVAKFLISQGIDKTRIKTISYGEEMPLDPAHNEQAWAINRRASFIAE